MNSSSAARSQLRPLALEQAGVVTREQAVAHGVSARAAERLVRDQQWRRLHQGVYLTQDAEPSFEARGWAGVLMGGDQARLGGLAAGHLLGLVDEPPATVLVLVPHGVRVRQREGWAFVRERTGARDPSCTGDPPCTTVPDTVLDLCADGRPEEAVDWVTLAVQRRLCTPEQLRRALGRRPRQRHRAVLLDLLPDVAKGAQSPIELTYLRDVEQAHDLPAGARQLPSADGSAVRDVWYEEYGVVVELDGRVGHEGLGRFRDMSRDNDAGLTGLLTLRYGHRDLRGRPCEVARQVAAALTQRGWLNPIVRCPRCRLVPL